MKNKNVLITGASQGLGAAIAHTFAATEYRVFVNCAHNVSNAQNVVAEIIASGGLAEVFQCDISNENEVNAKIPELEKHTGGIDVLINNARLDPYLRPNDVSDGDWFDRTFEVNLKGAYMTTLAVISGMKERGWGRIVNVSSIWAFWPAENRSMIPYSVSKAGMHALTRAFSLEGAPYGVTVNTVAPGLIMTDNASRRLNEEQLQKLTATIPLGRGGAPKEIAQVILNTVSSEFINGETINVNGGAYMGN